MAGYNWEKADAWRQHPLLTKNLRHAMPGFVSGLALFAVYVAYDKLVASSGKKGHH